MQQVVLPLGILVLAAAFLTGTFRFWLARLGGRAGPAAVATAVSAAAAAAVCYVAALGEPKEKEIEERPPLVINLGV